MLTFQHLVKGWKIERVNENKGSVMELHIALNERSRFTRLRSSAFLGRLNKGSFSTLSHTCHKNRFISRLCFVFSWKHGKKGGIEDQAVLFLQPGFSF